MFYMQARAGKARYKAQGTREPPKVTGISKVIRKCLVRMGRQAEGKAAREG